MKDLILWEKTNDCIQAQSLKYTTFSLVHVCRIFTLGFFTFTNMEIGIAPIAAIGISQILAKKNEFECTL